MHRKRHAWIGLTVVCLGLLIACAEVTTSEYNEDVQIYRTSTYGKIWAPLEPVYRNTLHVGSRTYYLVDYNNTITHLIASKDLHAVALRFEHHPWALIFVHQDRWWICPWPGPEEPRPDNFPAWKETAVAEFYATRNTSSHNSKRRGALLMSEAMGDDVMADFLEATAMAEFDDIKSRSAKFPDEWLVFFRRLPPPMAQALHTKLLARLRQEPHPKLFSRLVLAASPQQWAGGFGKEMSGMFPQLEADEVHPQAHERLSSIAPM